MLSRLEIGFLLEGLPTNGVIQRRHPEIGGDAGIGDGHELESRVLDLVINRRGDDLTDPLTEPSRASLTGHGDPP